MDLFFHAILPYFLGGYFNLEKKLIAALVLGGITPDLDTLFSWINDIYPTSILLVHRGITHTIFFGFFFAFVVLYLCAHEPVRGFLRWLIKVDLDFSAKCMAYVYAGVLLHLAIDYTTTRGIPLFYPWQSLRYSADIFSMMEMSILAASLVVLAVLWRQRAIKKFNKNLFIIFIIFFLVIGGIRIEGKDAAKSFFEEAGEKVQIYPDFDLFSWIGLDDHSQQFRVYRYSFLRESLTDKADYPKLAVASSEKEAKEAIAEADELSPVMLFYWRAYAVAVNATSIGNESWDIEYYDPVVKMQMNGANVGSFMKPRPKGYGSVDVVVERGKATMMSE